MKKGGPGLGLPPELWGETPIKLTPEQDTQFKQGLWDKGMALSRYYRRTYPDMKLVFGNSGFSAPLCAEFFRR